MTDDLILSPFGTARRMHLGLASTEAGSIENLLAHLSRSVQDFNLEGEMVQLAWEAARWQPGLSSEEQQALLLLVLSCLIMQQQGSTRVPLEDEEGLARLTSIIRTLLPDQGPDAEATIVSIRTLIAQKKADLVIGRGQDFKPLIFEGGHLSLYKMLHLEERLVRKLGQVIATAGAIPPDRVQAAMSILEKDPVPLEEEQKQAVRKAITSSFSIITGGPGTGKTTVILSLLRAFLHLGLDPTAIALAAPTGRAANRMSSSIAAAFGDDAVSRIPKPQTLHRLLGYSQSRDSFAQHRNNPLPQDVVIVDEASMVDLFLMERLLGAVKTGGRLVLIGDAEQLPSVEAGAVFKDLVSADTGYTVRLEKSHRMQQQGAGAGIYAAAQAVRNGSSDELLRVMAHTTTGTPAFRGAELLEPRDAGKGLKEFLDVWDRFRRGNGAPDPGQTVFACSRDGLLREATAELDAVFAGLLRCKVLCLTRSYRTGTDAVNGWFHERARRSGSHAGDAEFLPGEPVIMQHNDYDKMIFNGDQGVVLLVEDEHGRRTPRAVFRQGMDYVSFRLDSMRSSLVHAYAVTVHKSQGSEYDHVALILPDREIPILTREMIYTGVTRSRQSVTIVGNSAVLASGVARPLVRFSGIATRMGKK